MENRITENAVMKAKRSTLEDRNADSRVYFLVFKLPALLIMPILGFMVEFLYELPFMLVCLLDSRFRK